ncbi:glycosyltransferase [Aurantibacter sp.]|uniref:glycosyltransferase n=1 Tax=Aurantibacter sp. TaxID=2807103 RepID=UPI0035C7C7D6
MNVLVQYFYGGKGTGALEHFIILLKAYSKENKDDKIFLVCRENSPINKAKEIIDNVNFIYFGGTILGLEIERLALMSFGIKKIIKNYNIDILWNVNLGTYTRIHIPQIVSLSNAFQVYPYEKINKLKRNIREKFKLKILRFFYKLSIKNIDIITVQTESMKKAVKKHFRKKVVIISKSVDSENDYSFNKNYSQNKKIDRKLKELENKNSFKLIYISSYYPHKNHKLLIDIAESLSEIDFDYVMLLSLSRELLIKEYGARALKLLEKDKIIPIGWVEKSYLKSLYSLSDSVIIPTLLESFSSSHIEAMQFGKPILTTDFNFTREVCDDAALYHSEKKTEDWVKSILEISKSPKLRNNLTNKGKNQLEKYPTSWSVIAIKMNQIFKKAAMYDKK